MNAETLFRDYQEVLQCNKPGMVSKIAAENLWFLKADALGNNLNLEDGSDEVSAIKSDIM